MAKTTENDRQGQARPGQGNILPYWFPIRPDGRLPPAFTKQATTGFVRKNICQFGVARDIPRLLSYSIMSKKYLLASFRDGCKSYLIHFLIVSRLFLSHDIFYILSQ
jgi:hypothetical protein